MTPAHLSTAISLLSFFILPLCIAAPTSNAVAKRITIPFFKKYAALGDSYGSGIGAGEYTGGPFTENWRCSRFTDAYGQQLHRELNDPEQREFSHKACAGKTAEEIRNQHVDFDTDLITLSAGGNNVGFSNLVDGCIYRFVPGRSPVSRLWKETSGRRAGESDCL
ncbi:hypothetical protein CC78DRAFT_575645 [Lojkania enalia]|uniref:SGNH hydrolase-type esterase domain-containing protein n=1 Tax=Lojkania enalia TaxID=147567 RepID=A0A9P4N981_9PLEO|nr:hypothetical protein CC78DRAFT_575645 [Didymosphaeria enalia]